MLHQNKEAVRKLLLRKLDDLARRDSRDDLIRDRSSDPWDQMQDRIELDLAISVMNKDWKTRKAVERALKLLTIDEYGICQDCGAEINPKRLEAIPWTTLCVYCQEDRDTVDFPVPRRNYRRAA